MVLQLTVPSFGASALMQQGGSCLQLAALQMRPQGPPLDTQQQSPVYLCILLEHVLLRHQRARQLDALSPKADAVGGSGLGTAPSNVAGQGLRSRGPQTSAGHTVMHAPTPPLPHHHHPGAR